MDRDARLHQCRYCVASFSTASGLGIHMRKKHPVEFNSGIDVERVNRRWFPEEIGILASLELELRAKGYQGPINQALAERMPGRSADSVRGVRGRREYAAVLEEMRRGAWRNPGFVEVEGVELRTLDVRALLVAEIERLGEELSLSQSPMVLRLVGLAREGLAGASVGPSLAGWVRSYLVGEVSAEPRVVRVREPLVPPADLGRGEDGRLGRRAQYGRIQELWKKDKRAVAQEVLRGAVGNPMHDAVSLWRYWAPLVERPSAPWTGEEVRGPRVPVNNELWSPVSQDEVKQLSNGFTSLLTRLMPCSTLLPNMEGLE